MGALQEERRQCPLMTYFGHPDSSGIIVLDFNVLEVVL
jgi:hypothetical protein